MSFDKTPYINRCKVEASERITKFYPLWKQANAANLIGFDANEKTAMISFIDAVRARCDQYETSISGASNEASVTAICESIDYSDITP